MIFQKGILLALASTVAAKAADEKGLNSRGTRRLFEQECTILKAEKEFQGEDGTFYSTGEKCYCELTETADSGAGIRGQGKGKSKRIIAEMKNLDKAVCSNAVSAQTLLASTGGFEFDAVTNTAKVPFGATISEINKNKDKGKSQVYGRRRLASTGMKQTLIVRAEFETSTGTNEANLSNYILGIGNDPVNLASQYSACSYEQLTFEPVPNNSNYNGLTPTDGVITVVDPDQSVNGIADSVIRNRMRDLIGGSQGVADHVLLCIPPGTNGGWIAYAYVNHWLSVYNNNWCNYVSGLMHEIGHNLGLAHSGEAQAYDDQSGMMGYSYSNNNAPEMCFNAAKTFQLGWFPTYHFERTHNNSFNDQISLVGFVEKTFRPNLSPDDFKMIIKLTGSNNDYYVHFNRKVGFNSGTAEGGDQVLVATRSAGVGYDASTLLSKLNANGAYTISGFGSQGDLTINVQSINTSTGEASVNILYGDTSPTPAPTPAPIPPTPAPVDPTPAPVNPTAA
eukprot:CAMPEP_0194239802 /NCGR_PEP_ID=MMETSP0158-20130606/6152_1 /TAXON_ID=33649 /ORGANISM="Thalassionema nitzschioides, Strain L26-B" /LENGTH=506 /DNA_ID=CAMNT_0038974361 /DNA_START=68 /DNA_END=1585 /DNA_ORIENTATION=+